MKQVKEIMAKKVYTVKEDDDVKSICKVLAKNKISGMPVLGKSGKLVGFISERDIIAAIPKPKFEQATARKLMSKKVRTIADDAPITHASKIFSEEKYRLLPVMRNGKLVGVIGRNDVVKYMMGNFY